jgi:hypothetical protein
MSLQSRDMQQLLAKLSKFLCNWRRKVFRDAAARGDRVAKWRLHSKRRSVSCRIHWCESVTFFLNCPVHHHMARYLYNRKHTYELTRNPLSGSFILWQQKFAFLISPCARHAPPTHPPWFYHPNNIWRRVRTMKLLIMQFFPPSCYFNPLTLKFSPKHPVLNFRNVCSSPAVRDHDSHPYKTERKKICFYVFQS